MGRGAALAIALELGGQDVYIPSPDRLEAPPGHDHPFARHLDDDAVPIVFAALGSGTIYVPKAARACVEHLAASGDTPAVIARRLHISIKTVRRYIRGA